MKSHYLGLDALRGVAAYLVLLHHIELSLRSHWFAKGYLGVDLFFVLSGFVIGTAYECKMNDGGMGFAGLMKARLLRLYPLTFLGALGGFAAMASGLAQPIPHPLLVLGLQLLFIPAAGIMSNYFPYSAQWSLLFELLVNIAHWAVLRKLSTRGVAIVTAVSAAALTLTVWRYRSLGVGWGVENFAGGLVRVSFSYSAGLLLYRLHRAGDLPKLNAPWWAVVAAPIVLIVGAQLIGFGWRADLATAFLLPFIVWAAIEVKLEGRVAQAAHALGVLSFPIYSLFAGPKRVVATLLKKEGISHAGELLVWLAYVLALTGAAYLAWKFFDEPLQRHFKARTLSARTTVAPQPAS